jgi:predicted Rossmann fold flavoprotein
MTPDVVIIGAGAAGLMCAIEAGKRRRQVLVLDHASKIGEKIRISGGGRCNFTNLHCAPDRYISQNAHFCRSALSRFSQHDFTEMVKRHRIAFHEKTLGQLFCDYSAKDIINMLLRECEEYGVTISMDTSVKSVHQNSKGGFSIRTSKDDYMCQSLVIATGGPPIPKIGATGFGYEIAKQFKIPVIPDRAGLVPLTFDPQLLEKTKSLSGVAIDPCVVKSQCGKTFREAILFTHRGISGPAILQISSYWKMGEMITINMMPDIDMATWLIEKKKTQPRTLIHSLLQEILPKRLAIDIAEELQMMHVRLADSSDKTLRDVGARINAWQVKPAGSEGYRTAEVALGGVDTHALSSKTMEARDVPGLYFIGEVVDVTGHLGGFNFQWAWSSGWCAGQVV